MPPEQSDKGYFYFRDVLIQYVARSINERNNQTPTRELRSLARDISPVGSDNRIDGEILCLLMSIVMNHCAHIIPDNSFDSFVTDFCRALAKRVSECPETFESIALSRYADYLAPYCNDETAMMEHITGTRQTQFPWKNLLGRFAQFFAPDFTLEFASDSIGLASFRQAGSALGAYYIATSRMLVEVVKRS